MVNNSRKITINLAKGVEPLPPVTVRQADAAKLLNMCPRTLAKLSAPAGSIPCIRLGGTERNMILYPVDALKAWAEAAAVSGGVIAINTTEAPYQKKEAL